jgi:hypothetical protein
VSESVTNSAPRIRRSLRRLVGVVALAGAVTALTTTAALAAPETKPSPPPSSTPTLTITPSALNFGAQVVGTTSADETVTITNPSAKSQVITGLVFVQNNFRKTASDCPGEAQRFVLTAGSSCTASFNFTPASTGVLSTTVPVTLTPDGLPGQTLTLTGTGTSPGAQPAVITEHYICGGGVCDLAAYVNNFFATQLSATGGTAPYTWSGQAPAGLTVQPDGIILGTPTSTGTSNFTVTVTDANGASATVTFAYTGLAQTPCQTGVTGNITEPLTGPAINGQTPSGTATLTDNDGNEDCAASLLTQVSGVNLPDGTQLWVTYDSVPAGLITLSGGSGSMTPVGNPNTMYGSDQVRIYTSFPTSGAQPILQGTQFS